MEKRVDYESLTYSLLEMVGYSRNDLGKVHNSMITGSKRFGGGNEPVFKGEVYERDFYSENFQLAMYFESADDSKWNCLSVRRIDRVVKVEELDNVSTLECRVGKKPYEKVDMPSLSVGDLARQICGLLSIKPKE